MTTENPLPDGAAARADTTEVTVHVLRLIDVGDAIDLEKVADRLRALEPTRGATLLRGPEPSPTAGVVLAREPLDLRLGTAVAAAFETQARVRLFDFGVAAFRFTFREVGVTAARLVLLANAVVAASEAFDKAARDLWATLSGGAGDAIVPDDVARPSSLLEDFAVFVLPAAPASENLDDTFAHVLLGEPAERRLAPSTVHEIARRAIRYYEDDVLLVDYDSAIVVDRSGALDLVEIFEIASAQLLEMRFYDAKLALAEANLSREVRRARSPFWIVRSPFRLLSRRAAVLALEVAEMTDRLERAITLIGDTYTVLVYRETARSFRLNEATGAVRDKIGMIARVAEALGAQVQSSRDTMLEVLVIVLIALEAVLALRK